MAIKHPFISDLIIRIALHGSDPGPPSRETLREVAIALDRVILLPDALNNYHRELMPVLRPLHAKLRQDPGTGLMRDALSLPYLLPLSMNVADDILESPLGKRSDQWLVDNRVDLLAINAAALEELHVQLQEELPQKWLRLLEDEEFTGRFDLPLPGYGADPDNGSQAPTGSFAMASRGGMPATEPTDRTSEGKLPVELFITLDEALSVENPNNVSVLTATLHIAYGGNEMEVIPSGFLYLEPGCTLRLRWYKMEGIQQNGPAAEVVLKDVNQTVILTGDEDYGSGQELEYDFERSGHRPCRVRGKVLLRYS